MRKLDDMNKACLLKLGWKIKNADNSLRCQMMKDKYDVNINMIYGVEAKFYDSSLWKSIVSVWNTMNDMTYWEI